VTDNPLLNRPYGPVNRPYGPARVPASWSSPNSPPTRSGSTSLVNRVREQVTRGRHAGYPRVTPTTRRLLEHWADPERTNRALFCQREAAETATYLSEVASRDTDVWMRNALDKANTPGLTIHDRLRVLLSSAPAPGR